MALTAFFQTGTLTPGAVLTLNTDGSFDYTPAGLAGAVEEFQYYANDGTVNSNTATVTLNVVAANIAPTANNDRATVSRTALTAIIDILGNDVDPENMLDATSVLFRGGTTFSTTTRGAGIAVNPDGTITYTPEGGGGPDYFWYTVKDTAGAISNEARVRIDRVRAGAGGGRRVR